ncbi:MAG: M20/M25/M40 family metallo-hydrolase, partial [Clostridia bacterium]|nr:M20/M25/M40 family metallo-hydrolase [Clostridia bacterium]
MWKYPPYSPTVEDGILYGRGTTDCKINLAAYMDALELLFKDGYRPDFDIYLAFGYNEEIMGGPRPGAKLICDALKERNISFGMILDESGSLYHTPDGNIAGKLVISEKGYADIEISRVKKGGHSARTIGHSALGEIANAICLIENNPMEQRLTDPVVLMLEKGAPYMKDEKLKDLCRDVRK